MTEAASKFSIAKREARNRFRESAAQGLSACVNAASYGRWLDDAISNARNFYLSHKNPDWDHILPAMDAETGETSLERHEIDLLEQKLEYERNLKNLDARFPAMRQQWVERYAREGGWLKGDFLARLPPDDPNFETAKRFHHKGWADSYFLEAEAAAGRASFTDFVDGCVQLFEDFAETIAAVRDGTAIQAQCEKLDELAGVFIRECTAKILGQAKRLGKTKAKRAINDLSSRVREISARAKQQIHENALAGTLGSKPTTMEPPTISDAKSFERWIQPLKIRLRRELISPEEALKELRAIADNPECAVKVRAYILEQLDALSETDPGFEDSAADGLREALRQESEKIRREAVAMIIDRIMAPPAIKDYQAAKRYAQRTEAIGGHYFERSSEIPESELASDPRPVQGAPPKPGVDIAKPEVQVPSATPKQIVDRSKVLHKIRSYEKLAARIGVHKDTLNAITNETRWVSDHSYDLVAEFCKCTPKDLHPSDLPRRKTY